MIAKSSCDILRMTILFFFTDLQMVQTLRDAYRDGVFRSMFFPGYF